MKETVLLYNFTDRERVMKLKQALLPLGFRLRAVEKKDYLKPVGVLAGLKGMGEDETAEYDGAELEDEMVVMAGFTSAQIDAFIKALRKKGVGKINYKAVLTDVNKDWDSLELYREIKEEHELMNKKTEEELTCSTEN